MSKTQAQAQTPLLAVSTEAVAGCIEVLRAIRADVDGFFKPPPGAPWAAECRALRKELMPLVEQLSTRMFGGKRPEEYKGDRWLRQRQDGARAQALARDAQQINGTRLRNARLLALQKLTEQPGSSVAGLVPLVPDGAVQTAEDSGRADDAAIGDAAAAQGSWMAFYAGAAPDQVGLFCAAPVCCGTRGLLSCPPTRKRI